jgi:hypothetical protein
MLWLLAVPLAVLLLASLAAKPAARARKRRAGPVPGLDEETPLELLDRDAPAAVALYGTPEVAEYLEANGRGDELRGLGYRGK